MPKKKPLEKPAEANRRVVYDEVCSIYNWARRMGYRDLADRLDAVAVAVWTNYPPGEPACIVELRCSTMHTSANGELGAGPCTGFARQALGSSGPKLVSR